MILKFLKLCIPEILQMFLCIFHHLYQDCVVLFPSIGSIVCHQLQVQDSGDKIISINQHFSKFLSFFIKIVLVLYSAWPERIFHLLYQLFLIIISNLNPTLKNKYNLCSYISWTFFFANYVYNIKHSFQTWRSVKFMNI